MEIKRRKKNKKMTWAIIFALVLALCGAYYFYILNGKIFEWSPVVAANEYTDSANRAKSAVELKDPTAQQINAGKDTKSDSIKDSGDTDNSDTSSSTGIELSVSSAINDKELRIQTRMNKVTNSGQCSVVLSKGDTTKSYPSVGVQALSDYSTCKGFEINTTGLSSGEWNITVNYSDPPINGKATTKIDIP